MIRQFSSSFALTLLIPSALAAPVEWRKQDGGNGHTYDLIGNYLDHSQRWNWHESKAMAEAMGGHLVTIGSAAENQFLIDTFHVHHKLPTWIGFSDEAVEGDWRWVTGEPVTYTGGWNPGSPDQTGNEDAALMGSQWGDHHLWNDSHASDHAPFFIEWEATAVPDSSAFAVPIAFLSLVGFGRFARRHEGEPAL